MFQLLFIFVSVSLDPVVKCKCNTRIFTPLFYYISSTGKRVCILLLFFRWRNNLMVAGFIIHFGAKITYSKKKKDVMYYWETRGARWFLANTVIIKVYRLVAIFAGCSFPSFSQSVSSLDQFKVSSIPYSYTIIFVQVMQMALGISEKKSSIRLLQSLRWFMIWYNYKIL